jgi:predicted  nucleic acid-binding Zn-ribbon protein
MANDLEILLQIQDKNIRIGNLSKQVNSVPVDKENAKLELEKYEAAVASAKAAIQDVESRVKTLELDVDTHKEKIRNLQTKSGEVKKNEEYKAMMQEISTHQEKITKLEDDEIVLWEELEAAKTVRKDAERDLDAGKKRIESTVQDLDVRETNCNEQIEKLKAEAAELEAGVDLELIQHYKRLLQKTDGGKQVIVPLQEENCGSCFLKVTKAIALAVDKGMLTPCEYCGSLIYKTN